MFDSILAVNISTFIQFFVWGTLDPKHKFNIQTIFLYNKIHYILSAKDELRRHKPTSNIHYSADKIGTVNFEIIEKIPFFFSKKCIFHTKYTWGIQCPITWKYVGMIKHGSRVKYNKNVNNFNKHINSENHPTYECALY